MIKVCTDPQCEEVAHNIEKDETRCRNCYGLMVEIDQSTYQKKFMDSYFQYDYSTGKLVRPSELGYSIQMEMF